MHDFDILHYLGSTKEKIREVFTSTEGENYEWRKKWEKKFESRIQEGTTRNLANYNIFAASDLAWDSNVITKMMIPLQLYAQGRVQIEYLKDVLKDVPAEMKKSFTETNEKGDITAINIPEFFKVSLNLVRSMVTRRTAALASRYLANFPFYKYEARSTSQVAKLRADVLSQRVESIVDQYAYRHDLAQSIREMLLYPYSVEFVSGAWDVERTLVKRQVREELTDDKGTPADGKMKIDARVSREGVLYSHPHPSRVAWDLSASLASLNSDTGISWIFYWNVLPFRDINNNTAYFNRSEVEYSTNLYTLLNGYRGYWELYFASAGVKFPDTSSSSFDLAGNNDRSKRAGKYTAEKEDQSVVLTEYFERIIPSEWGLGEYSVPIWVRLVIAGGTTVVFGEFLPDTPGVAYQYNNHDGRTMNNAFATDILPYMDQTSNMLVNLLHLQKAASIKVISCDIDLVNDKEVLAGLRAQVQGDAIYTRPLWVEYKGTAYADTGMKPQQAIAIAQTDPINDVTAYLRAVAQVMAMAERNLGFSANESAQSEPREVSATENANIATTVSTSTGFMSVGIDEGIDAKKRITYKALMSLGSSKIQVPVANRYLDKTIKAAGFEVISEDQDQQVDTNLAEPKRCTILGTKSQLEYEYNFTSRDGSERVVNAKSAETLVNMLAQLANLPGVLQDLGKEQLYLLLNEIARLAGASVDLRFEVKDGQGEGVSTGDPVSDNGKAIDQAINQIVQAIQKDEQKLAQLEQAIQQLVGAAPSPIAAPAAPEMSSGGDVVPIQPDPAQVAA